MATSDEPTRVSNTPIKTKVGEEARLLFQEGKSGTTQFTQYSVSQSHSAGFVTAKALVEQSIKGEGIGRLLKKRFLLEAVLGHGGMGTVYKAKDLRKVEAEDPSPYIATKVLNQGFRDHPDAFIALQQETAKSQTLAHPNIVTVHDFDRDGDTLFMTMELLEGQPLDKQIQECHNRGMPKTMVWLIVRDLCAALAYAHQRNLIHADFKPGNIFVTPDGHAKVLDFGIARAASKEAQKHKFDAGQLGALTPAYATIEMINDEPICFADDVYALACVTYEMLTGRHPYHYASALDASVKDIQPKRPRKITNREWRVLQKGLAVKKKDRFATINEFANALFPKPISTGMKITFGLMMVSVMGTLGFAYDQYQSDRELQNKISTQLAEAQECFELQDYECAVAASLVAVNLDPDNIVALELHARYEKLEFENRTKIQINRLLKEASICVEAKDSACVQVKAKEILSLDNGHAQGLVLIETANKLQNEEELHAWLVEGNNCLQNDDLVCARMFLDKAKLVNANHPSLTKFEIKVVGIEQKAQAQQAHQNAIIAKFLQEGEACFLQQKYDCVLEKTANILAEDSANADAIILKQRAETAKLQQHETNQKVNKLLVEANECMERKNYVCAIAKAETALDLAPENEKARSVKNKAQKTQRKPKEFWFKIK